MASYSGFEKQITQIIRVEKARHNLTLSEISERLAKIGIDQTANNLSTKLSRGDMSAQLFLAILSVMGTESIRLND